MAMPKKLRDRIDALIRRGAAELKFIEPDEYSRGLRNQTIRQHVQERAENILARQFKTTVEIYLSTRIPLVLAKRSTDEFHTFQSCLPELKLPEWLNVPSDTDGDTQHGGWKLEVDATPNQLTRLIDHRDEIIRGHEIEREKYVLLRATALDKGCDPDAAIRTVFFPDDKKPPSPEIRPPA